MDAALGHGTNSFPAQATAARERAGTNPFKLKSKLRFARCIESMSASALDSTLLFNVGGMTCSSCQGHVQRTIMAVAGVSSCAVHLDSGVARVAGAAVDAASVSAAVAAAGYSCTLAVETSVDEDAATLRLLVIQIGSKIDSEGWSSATRLVSQLPSVISCIALPSLSRIEVKGDSCLDCAHVVSELCRRGLQATIASSSPFSHLQIHVGPDVSCSTLNRIMKSISSFKGVTSVAHDDSGQLIVHGAVEPARIMLLLEDEGMSAQPANACEQAVVNFDCEGCDELSLSSKRLLAEASSKLNPVTTREGQSLTLVVQGMTCGACAAHVTSALSEVAGAENVSVNLITGSAHICNWTGSNSDLISALQAKGYGGHVVTAKDSVNFTNQADIHLKLWFKFFCCAAFITAAQSIFTPQSHLRVTFMSDFAMSTKNSKDLFFAALLSTFSEALCILSMGQRALSAIRTRMGNMELLVTSACSLSYLYSFVVFAAIQFGWSPMPDFFDTPVLLVFFVSMGKTIEAKARSVTAHSLLAVGSKSLPDIASLTTPSGTVQVPSSSLQIGARVVVGSGFAIPCDGVVVEGSASVNESSVTGEPLPALKTIGDDVFASCVLIDGSITVRATRVAENTTICLLSRLVADAHNGRVSLQDITDKIASKFVASILVLSLATFTIWLILLWSGFVQLSDASFPIPVAASLFAVSLMVAACPCALGLAAPTAIAVATGVGARLGVIFKGGSSFETCHKVDTVLLDKTGTITEGLCCVRDVKSCKTSEGATTIADIMRHAALCAAKTPEHPISRAVLVWAEEHLQSSSFAALENVIITPGSGVEGIVTGVSVCLGSREFLESRGYNAPLEDNCSEVGGVASATVPGSEAIVTCVWIGWSGCIRGRIDLSDVVRSDAADIVGWLHAQGIEVWMVTGDNEAAANIVASAVDIPRNRVIAHAVPSRKLQAVQELQEQGHIVAFVGDGLNDTLAMAAADVGVAVGQSYSVFLDAADVVLAKRRICDVATMLHLSHVTFRRILINIAWATLYNFCMIPLAAGAFYPSYGILLPPWASALAMAASSVSVMVSSLWILRFRPPMYRQARRRFPDLELFRRGCMYWLRYIWLRPKGHTRLTSVDMQ